MSTRKKILIGFAAFFGLILAALVITAAFFEDRIGRIVVQELNKSLKKEMTVGEVDLSLIRYFPSANIALKDVVIPDAIGGNLLEAKDLSLRFGWGSLFSSQFTIKSVAISEGSVYVSTDEKGNANYDIFTPSEEDVKASEEEAVDFQLLLNEAEIRNVELIYIDKQEQQELAINIDQCDLSGEFSNEKFALVSNAEIKSRFIDLESGRFFVGKDFAYDGTIDVDFVNGIYGFRGVEIYVESNKFKVNGEITSAEDHTNFDLNVNTDDASIISILSLLPDDYFQSVGDFDSRGRFRFDATIKGRSDDKHDPFIGVEFGLKDGRISSDRFAYPLKKVNFSAKFSTDEKGDMSKATFDVSDFKGYFGSDPLDLALKIENINDPKIDFKFNGAVPLDAVYGLLENKDITDGSGKIHIKGLNLKGRYNDMINQSRIAKVKASGTVGFENAMLKINGERLYVKRGDLKLNGNDLKIANLKITGADSDFLVNGDFHNVVPVLFADSINSKDAELKFKATLKSDKVDFDKLMATLMPPVKEEKKKEFASKGVDKTIAEADIPTEYDMVKVERSETREFLTNFLKGKFSATIKSFKYRQIKGQNFNGNLEFKNSQLLVKQLKVKAMGGNFEVNSKVYFKKRPYLEAYIDCTETSAKEFFKQCENFGQDYLTTENIRGILNAKILIRAYWDKKGNFLDKKLYVLTDLKINNGELIDFKMLEDFSTFIKLKDLKHISFTDLHNQIEIKDNTMYIPAMFIQSNAVNLTLMGTHDFDHNIDYKVKVNVAQVLANKFKKYNPIKRPIKAKKKGWFNLYVHMYGPLETFEMSYSKKTVKEALEASLAREFQTIQNTIKAEFEKAPLTEPKDWGDEGSERNATPTPVVEKPAVKPKPRPESGGFNPTVIDEGDDDEELEFIEGF